MPLKTLLGLILGNLIWSLNPTMGKVVLADFSPSESAWLRYGSAFLAFVAFRFFFQDAVFPKMRRKEWLTLIVVGGLAFCLSPLLQFTGLDASRATDNALIIAMEPLVTVLLAALLLREGITLVTGVALGVALIGFALLSGFSLSGLTVPRAHLYGDLLMLLSLGGEACYSVGCRKLVARHSPVSIFGVLIFSGVIFLTAAVCGLGGFGPVHLLWVTAHQMTWKSAAALLWLGPLGTTASYLYWIYALKEAPVASVALTLFIQPVFGALWGYGFLGERLNVCQSLGGTLIVFAVFAQTVMSIRHARLGRHALQA